MFWPLRAAGCTAVTFRFSEHRSLGRKPNFQMEEPVVRDVDIAELISYSNDLAKLLRDQKDVEELTEALERANQLHSSSYNDSTDLENRMQVCKSKIKAFKQEIEEIKRNSDSSVAQKELEEELRREEGLQNELSEEIEFLERQWVSVEELKEASKKMTKDEFRMQKLLSMYASVTTIIPDLKDGADISGQILDRDKNSIEKFDFDLSRTSDFEICNTIWKMIDS